MLGTLREAFGEPLTPQLTRRVRSQVNRASYDYCQNLAAALIEGLRKELAEIVIGLSPDRAEELIADKLDNCTPAEAAEEILDKLGLPL